MVRYCMSANGVGELVFIDEIMEKYRYIYMLAENLEDSVKKLGLNEYYF